ncbi:MAG: hypothetical protein KJ941_01340 [Bacteroidetes bacterium]|nr:hypothetical protein [Bacteroidota bacterium]
MLADSLIIVAWLWEKLKYGAVHPTMLYVGLFIIVEQTTEVIIFDSPPWRKVATWLYHVLSF